MSDLLGIGLSGLRTSRNNISVTGHNISNIDTPGYSRQRAVQITSPAFGTGNGYMGTGSRTQTIERIVDEYTIHQVRVDTSRLKDNEAFLRQASELDNLLSNENSALGNALNGFFEGMQSAANDPLSKPGRELVFSQLDSVSQRFKTANSRLADQNNNINTQLRTYSEKINELSTGIGEINKQILVYQGSRNQPPNDLFDRRDELLRELSEIVDVNVSVQDGLNINVSIGNGIPLITGENVNKLEAVPGRNDKGRYEVNMIDSRGSKMHITNEISGGEMGGVVRYRADTLDPALNEMGRIALVFAGEMNNQHHAGTDLNGDQGVDLFKNINTKEFQLDRISGLQRDASAGVWLDPEGLNKLPANEFLLAKNAAGEYILKDSVTGTTMVGPQAALADLNDDVQDKYGFRISDGGAGNPPGNLIIVAGDKTEDLINRGGLLISPVRIGASQLERSPELTDTNKIALAGIAGAENNAGTAKMGYVSLVDGGGQKISLGDAGLTGYQIEVLDSTAIPPTFELKDALGNLIPVDPASVYDPVNGTLSFIDIDGTGNDLVVSVSNNDLNNEDTWTLEGTAGGSNGTGLSFLQQAKLIESKDDGSGGASLSETYSMLVEKVGIQTSESRTATQVSLSTLKQSISMRESVAGVNMDEEAGNLIRFQQAYMASTQVISAAQKLFDTLLASVGR